MREMKFPMFLHAAWVAFEHNHSHSLFVSTMGLEDPHAKFIIIDSISHGSYPRDEPISYIISFHMDGEYYIGETYWFDFDNFTIREIKRDNSKYKAEDSLMVH